MKRLAWVSEWYPPAQGGLEETSQRWARIAAALGLAVEVVTPAFTPGHAGSWLTTEEGPLTVTRVWPGPNAPYRRWVVDALAARGPFDGLVCQFITSFGADVTRLGRLWGVPTVVAAHGRDVMTDLFQPETAPFIHEAIANATRVTSVTRDMIQALKPFRVLDDIIHWPNVVDRDLFRPMPRNRATQGIPDGLIIGFLGKLRPSKGLHDVLAALPLVVRKRPDAHLVVIGGLREDVKPVVAAWSQQHPDIAVHLHVLPYTAQDRLPELIVCLDLAWLPSIFDGSPNGLMQMMACEVPAIATPVGGIPDLIVDGENGVLIPVGDFCALAEATVRLGASPAHLRRLGRQARAGLPDDHRPGAEVQRMRDLFQDVGLLPGGGEPPR